MEYTVNKLSKMSGISARTLRFYDEIGLLKPAGLADSGYRLYGQAQVDLLQQILFYRELGFALEEIKNIMYAADFDKKQSFRRHLAELTKKRERMDTLIGNVKKSMAAMEGEIIMKDNEKFEGFVAALVDEIEEKYGAEVREKYGDAIIDAANARVKGLNKELYDESERLRLAYEGKLKEAFEAGDPTSELAQEASDLHRKWLCVFYPAYDKEYHAGLGEMYLADERFKAYYEKLGAGITEFFRDAINAYCTRM